MYCVMYDNKRRGTVRTDSFQDAADDGEGLHRSICGLHLRRLEHGVDVLIPDFSVPGDEATLGIAIQYDGPREAHHGAEGDAEHEILVEPKFDLGRGNVHVPDEVHSRSLGHEEFLRPLDPLVDGIAVDLVGEDGPLVVNFPREVGRHQEAPFDHVGRDYFLQFVVREVRELRFQAGDDDARRRRGRRRRSGGEGKNGPAGGPGRDGSEEFGAAPARVIGAAAEVRREGERRGASRGEGRD
mmetsp:Transcript_10627/g.31405  ORF Transcript_10627/g.31405 Transcript_10627/m.31405 type:complete len:241 (+) Transcript_10627:282-1004(+)